MKSLKRESLVELTVAELTAQIADGKWAVGEPLPGEVRLAEELGVGRSTVREATKALARMGLVESRQGAGTFVRATSATPTWDRLALAARIREVYEVRDAIEVQAASLAAQRADADDVAAIRNALALRGDRHDGPAAFVEHDLDFHRAVVRGAHNQLLLELFDAFSPTLADALASVIDHTGAEADAIDAAHAELVDAIAARDPERAARAARVDFETTTRIVDRAGDTESTGGAR